SGAIAYRGAQAIDARHARRPSARDVRKAARLVMRQGRQHGAHGVTCSETFGLMVILGTLRGDVEGGMHVREIPQRKRVNGVVESPRATGPRRIRACPWLVRKPREAQRPPRPLRDGGPQYWLVLALRPAPPNRQY